MPFKEKLKRGKAASVKKKPRKKITNWSKYNKSLKKRGSLAIFIEDDVLKN